MECDIGTSQTLLDRTMRCVQIDGQKILVARVGGVCHAVDATCPHAGVPLEQDVLHGEMLVCPWHKATFRITDGLLTDPPAVDALVRYPVCETDGRIMVSSKAPPPIVRSDGGQLADERFFVIAGAGAAGVLAAQALREEGFAGRVVMLDQESRPSYDRTVVSKYRLAGQHGGEKSPLQDVAYDDSHHIGRLTCKISRINPAARRIDFSDSPSLEYSALLVATDAAPRPLEVPAGTLPGIFLLRSAADAEAIAAAAAQAHRVVIAGAGFIGMEAAASLWAKGLTVAVVAPEQAPFERQFGAKIGGAVQRVHERNGVTFHLGETAVAVEGEGQAQFVRLQSGVRIPAAMALAGMGARPNTAMFADLPLRPDGVVPVNAGLRAAGDLFAAGDIAAFPPRSGGDLIRIEHWRVAQQQGRLAARNMLGAAASDCSIRFFWTPHFRQRLDYVGHAEHWDEIVVDGDLEVPNFIAWYIEAGVVRAVAGWGQERRMAGVLAHMHDRLAWSLTELRHATQHLHA